MGKTQGDRSNTSVVHMHDQRNAEKMVVFKLNAILENRGKLLKCAYFQEKESSLDSIRRHIGTFFFFLTPILH